MLIKMTSLTADRIVHPDTGALTWDKYTKVGSKLYYGIEVASFTPQQTYDAYCRIYGRIGDKSDIKLKQTKEGIVLYLVNEGMKPTLLFEIQKEDVRCRCGKWFVSEDGIVCTHEGRTYGYCSDKCAARSGWMMCHECGVRKIRDHWTYISGDHTCCVCNDCVRQHGYRTCTECDMMTKDGVQKVRTSFVQSVKDTM